MAKVDLNNMEGVYFDVLREIGNIGAGNATTALAQMLNTKVDMHVPKVDLIGFSEIGEVMGRMMAREILPSGFFDDIDGIVPIPLAPARQRQRGYNQSQMLAEGINSVTQLPIYNKVVRRTVFEGSQTHRGRWERNENVEHVFRLTDATAANGRHLLLVDDVVTTGATILACARELASAGNVKISILSLAFAKS